MARRAKTESEGLGIGYSPTANPEDRENQMVALAQARAAQQMIDGTASAQVICHYLRLGTAKSQLELELLKREARLKEAKTNSIESGQNLEQLMQEAMAAFASYQPNDE